MRKLRMLWKYKWHPRNFHNFEKAVAWCHVRSAIYLPLGKHYWKNRTESLRERIPWYLRIIPLWREYDPRDDDDGSLFMFND